MPNMSWRSPTGRATELGSPRLTICKPSVSARPTRR